MIRSCEDALDSVVLDPVRGPEFQREPSLTKGARVQAKALPEAGSAPTWFARFSNGSGTIGRVERYVT